MIMVLAAISVLAGQTAPAGARPVADPVIEKLFYPAFQLHQTIDKAMRRAPAFRAAFARLGDKACPVYLAAWQHAYDAHFAEYRAATYAVVRKQVPKEALDRPGLKLFDAAVIDQYGAGVAAEMNSGPAGVAMRQIGTGIAAEVLAAAQAAPPKPEADASKVLDASGNLCLITTNAVERSGFLSQ